LLEQEQVYLASNTQWYCCTENNMLQQAQLLLASEHTQSAHTCPLFSS